MLMKFYSWLEKLALEAIQRESGRTKVFHSDTLKVFKECLNNPSPYLSEVTVKISS